MVVAGGGWGATQVYVALLRAFQPEARSLVRQALDILTPALDKRLPSSDPWIRWTKKILVEEGHSLPQLIHILQLLTRCPSPCPLPSPPTPPDLPVSIELRR